MIEALLLVLALSIAFVIASRKGLPLQTKRSGKMGYRLLWGLALFVIVVYLSYAFITPQFVIWFGTALGTAGSGILALVLAYFIYAFIVKKTGAAPTL